MKRNLDLVRELMLRLEAIPMDIGDAVHVSHESEELAGLEASPSEIAYHLDLLRDNGWLVCPSAGQPMDGVIFTAFSWEGHDFVDAIRSADVWAKTKAGAQRAGGWTMGLLLDFAKAVIKHELSKLIPS